VEAAVSGNMHRGRGGGPCGLAVQASGRGVCGPRQMWSACKILSIRHRSHAHMARIQRPRNRATRAVESPERCLDLPKRICSRGGLGRLQSPTTSDEKERATMEIRLATSAGLNGMHACMH
jgi:hypothetical protein